MESFVAHPVRTDLQAPLEVARWRALFQWILAIPHLIVAGAMAYVAGALVFIAWFAILFTGRMPEGIYRFLALYLRYQWRAYAYAGFLHEDFPPFEFEMSGADDGHSPARLDIDPPGELSRGLIFVKWLLAIPHYVVLFFVGIAAVVAYLIGWFSVLFTGRWPEGVRALLVGVFRWSNRVTGYVYLLTDEYPPFSLR